MDVGVAYRISPCSAKKLHNCGGFLLQLLRHQQFSSVHGHTITGSLTVLSHSHGQVLDGTDCDPGRSCKYGSYSSDHPPLGPVCSIMPNIMIGGHHLE